MSCLQLGGHSRHAPRRRGFYAAPTNSRKLRGMSHSTTTRRRGPAFLRAHPRRASSGSLCPRARSFLRPSGHRLSTPPLRGPTPPWRCAGARSEDSRQFPAPQRRSTYFGGILKRSDDDTSGFSFFVAPDFALRSFFGAEELTGKFVDPVASDAFPRCDYIVFLAGKRTKCGLGRGGGRVVAGAERCVSFGWRRRDLSSENRPQSLPKRGGI